MIVRFKCFGPLRSIIGERIMEIDVPEGSTIRNVIDRIIELKGEEARRLILDGTRVSGNLILMLNRRDVDTLDGEETRVDEGDTVTMLPHVQGG